MAWRALQSQHLNGADYDPHSRTLAIQFTNGSVYRYAGVAPTTADTLFQSGSPGSYFHSKIKGLYPEQKVREGQTKAGNVSRSKRF
jgi:hypothetical protein